MSNETCESCKHFHQHYSLKNGILMRVHCGHCIFPRVKHKRPCSKICEHFIPGVPDEEIYATQKYLTKEMIRKLFNMEFFPLAKDATEDC